MSKYAKDPELAAIAAKVKTLAFIHPPDSAALEMANSRIGSLPPRNACLFPASKTWAVRLYLGKEQRVLGSNPDWRVALRFADMCAVFFANTRVRGGREPGAGELNFGISQAKLDLSREIEALAIIKELESYFNSIGALYDAARTIAEKRRPEELLARILRQQESTDARLDIVAARLERLNEILASVGKLNLAVDSLREGLKALWIKKQEGSL